MTSSVTAAPAPGATTLGGRLWHAYHGRRYAILFYVLMVTIGAMPLSTALGFGVDLLQILMALSLLLSVLDVSDRRWRTALVIVAAVVFGLRAAPASTIGAGMATGALVTACGLAVLATVSASRFAFRARVVDAEHVYAALDAYLLGGLFFAGLYWGVASAWPGSFADAGAGPAAGFPLSTAIYYSFVTLATLGYGDVIPRSDVARGLAIVEAVAGQLYVAVLIARLVGARLQGQGAEDSTRGGSA